jgi:SAM-dependent methyltransferase
VTGSTDHPYPPLHLASRVLSLDGAEDPYGTYERRGAEAKSALIDLLPDDWSFSGKRVLDFGCGAGRTLRHFLPEARSAEFWGADLDGASIDWLQGALCPPLHVVRGRETPPLGLEHGSFDLAYALSVFTHLTESSLPWLLELHALLKPGGLLIATYMGRWNSEIFTGEPWDEDAIGMNVLRHDQPWDSGGPVVLMSDWWVRAHWGRAFEIVDVAPNVHGQSWALLRRRDVALTAADLERPADDPREWAALRHNLRQVQRDHVAAMSEIRRSYERSASWRLTAPLRAGARTLRSIRSALLMR